MLKIHKSLDRIRLYRNKEEKRKQILANKKYFLDKYSPREESIFVKNPIQSQLVRESRLIRPIVSYRNDRFKKSETKQIQSRVDHETGSLNSKVLESECSRSKTNSKF